MHRKVRDGEVGGIGASDSELLKGHLYYVPKHL